MLEEDGNHQRFEGAWCLYLDSIPRRRHLWRLRKKTLWKRWCLYTNRKTETFKFSKLLFWCMCDRASYMKMTRGTNLMQQLWFIIINISTCSGHLYVHLQEYRLCGAAYGVQHWVLWLWS